MRIYSFSLAIFVTVSLQKKQNMFSLHPRFGKVLFCFTRLLWQVHTSKTIISLDKQLSALGDEGLRHKLARPINSEKKKKQFWNINVGGHQYDVT